MMIGYYRNDGTSLPNKAMLESAISYVFGFTRPDITIKYLLESAKTQSSRSAGTRWLLLLLFEGRKWVACSTRVKQPSN